MNLLERRPRILFLFSDTGGGHRSAAEAIIEAMQLEFGEQIVTEKVDFLKEYAPLPLNQLPDWYPYMVKMPQAWGVGFHLSDGDRRARFINDAAWPYIRRATRKFASHANEYDLIVSVHPLINTPMLRALGRSHVPYVTVVTDLVSTHALWYTPRVDLCIVPTEAARRRAIKFGMPEEKLQVVGLPVAERFCQPPGDRAALRQRMGWPQDRPVVLIVGGGEGMGPMGRISRRIDHAGLPVALAIVTGRNQKLKARLADAHWTLPTYLYGFVRDMPDLMRAADVLVTKAGPGTISEAFNASLPIVLYSRLPGQEDGNVKYVLAEGAGAWAPTAHSVVHTLRDWLYYPEKRLQAVDAARRLARPGAARQIARILAARVGVEPAVEA
ncbi:MAG: MGDG synthase family glycosyltransferase [Chloroflexota bacterium]